MSLDSLLSALEGQLTRDKKVDDIGLTLLRALIGMGISLEVFLCLSLGMIIRAAANAILQDLNFPRRCPPRRQNMPSGQEPDQNALGRHAARGLTTWTG